MFSFGALVVAGFAFRQSARGEISAERVGRSPAADHYCVEVMNVGDAAARHVVVGLRDAEGRQLCERPRGRSLLSGQSHRYVLTVDPKLPPVYPLTVQFEWRRWKRRSVEKYPRFAWLWRIRAKSTRTFAESEVEEVAPGVAVGVAGPPEASTGATVGPAYLPCSRATPRAVAQHLKPVDERCAAQSPSWAELLENLGGTGQIGEIRTPADWAEFPHDRSIRVAAAKRDGEQVIRWVADQRRVKDHDAFYRVEDTERPRTGNVTVLSKDEPLLVES